MLRYTNRKLNKMTRIFPKALVVGGQGGGWSFSWQLFPHFGSDDRKALTRLLRCTRKFGTYQLHPVNPASPPGVPSHGFWGLGERTGLLVTLSSSLEITKDDMDTDLLKVLF